MQLSSALAITMAGSMSLLMLCSVWLARVLESLRVIWLRCSVPPKSRLRHSRGLHSGCQSASIELEACLAPAGMQSSQSLMDYWMHSCGRTGEPVHTFALLAAA